MEWDNQSLIKDFDERLDDLLGFVYEITLTDGRYYIGRKQFRTQPRRKTGKSKKTDWETYNSSSKVITDNPELIARKEIIGVFSSKSAMRFAETACIIWSNSYLDPLGLNWSFDSCKGTLKLTEEDVQQLGYLKTKWQN